MADARTQKGGRAGGTQVGHKFRSDSETESGIITIIHRFFLFLFFFFLRLFSSLLLFLARSAPLILINRRQQSSSRE